MRSLHDREDASAEVADGRCRHGRWRGGRPSGGGAIRAGDGWLRAGGSNAARPPPCVPWTPEIARRLGKLAGDGDEAFAVTPEGDVLWAGALAAKIVNAEPVQPPRPADRRTGSAGRARPGSAADRGLAGRRGGQGLRDLRRLKTAIESGALKGLPRGIAFRLVEAGGVHRPARRRTRSGRAQPGRAAHDQDLRHSGGRPLRLAAGCAEGPWPRNGPGLRRRPSLSAPDLKV